MAETKTIQKGWRFSPEIIAKLEELCAYEIRSEQNMVEVLIDRAHAQIPLINYRENKSLSVSRIPDPGA